MTNRRVDRLNSLLKEVISEVIVHDVRNPDVSEFVTVTRVEVTSDLKYGKVYISVIGDDKARQKSVEALNSAAGFISTRASKKVVLRYFPSLRFLLDDSIDNQMRIEQLLNDISAERKNRDDEQEAERGE